MSASFHWIAWNSTIFLPNASRSFAYASESSRHARAIPTGLRRDADASTIERGERDLESLTGFAPGDSPPARGQSWKISCAVSEPRIPSLCYELSNAEASRSPRDDERRDAAVCPAFASVWANTSATSALAPLVMKFFVPFRIHAPPFAARGRSHRRRVAARRRLRQREAPELRASGEGPEEAGPSARRCRSGEVDRRRGRHATT